MSCNNCCQTNTVSPRDDFYQYVNKQWLEDPENAIPDDQCRWGSFFILRENSLTNQIDIIKQLMDIPYDELSDVQQKVITVWKACIANEIKQNTNDQSTYNCISNELKMFDNIMEHKKTIDNTTYVYNSAKYLYHSLVNGIPNLFEFDKSQDFNDSNKVVLDFYAI